jgi:hypothetical protein
MTDLSSPPPEWAQAAAQAGTELGLGPALSGVDADQWARVCRRAGQILAGRGHVLPPGWDRALARSLGRADPDVLAHDEADAILAEKGEVFAPEDDA